MACRSAGFLFPLFPGKYPAQPFAPGGAAVTAGLCKRSFRTDRYPPVILIDERQWLFFYRGVPIPLRPVLFSYLFLLAQSPREVVPREAIYNHLWPGELDFEGSNKPYEVQVSDHKRKLMARIRKGIAGRVEIREGEVDELITTKDKIGYVLNCDRENILILRKQDYAGPSFPVCFLALGQCLADWLDWLGEATEVLWLC